MPPVTVTVTGEPIEELPPVPPVHQTIPADLKIDRSSQVQDFSNEVSTLLQEAATLFSK